MSLIFTYAVMNGGKSTLLLQTSYSASSRGFHPIVIGYKDNSRDFGIASRLGVSTGTDLLFDKNTNIKEQINSLLDDKGRDNVLEILIDEAQFLTPYQVEELLVFSIENDIDVKCFGLKTNFETKFFPGSMRLLELADEIVELDLVRCKCGKKAKINARFSVETGELLSSGPEELIEGSVNSVIYDPICVKCFLDHGGRLS